MRDNCNAESQSMLGNIIKIGPIDVARVSGRYGQSGVDVLFESLAIGGSKSWWVVFSRGVDQSVRNLQHREIRCGRRRAHSIQKVVLLVSERTMIILVRHWEKF